MIPAEMQETIIQYLQVFRELPDQDAQAIANCFIRVTYKTGEYVSQPGEVASKLFFINKGILKVTLPDEEDRDITYFFLKEGQLTGFLYSLYDEIPAEQGLQAACDTEIYVIAIEKLYGLFQQLPYLRELIDKIAYLSMVDMIKIKNSYLTGDALKKYELFLKTQPEIALHVMQIDIASYLGITPQSLSRIRKNIA